ncbi:MAG TPA: hypothetical protein VJU83_09595 [Burkholderiales bacterium]|nr:hypothetical protein [Burkholderiales bacterium]
MIDWLIIAWYLGAYVACFLAGYMVGRLNFRAYLKVLRRRR